MRLPQTLDREADGFALHQISAAVQGGYHRQHNVDDTHGTIIATGTVTEKSRSKAMGYWTSILPLPATSFNGNAAAWTVSVADQLLLHYMLIGETCFLQFDLVNTTVVAGNVYLAITLPTALLPASLVPASSNMSNSCEISDNGTFVAGFSQAVIASTGLGELRILRHDLANFAAATDATTVRGTAIFKLANP